MQHNRLDYQDIQDPQGRIGEDEPVFFLRAKCPIAARTVLHWAGLAEAAGSSDEYVNSVRRFAAHMQKWHDENGRETPPDAPREVMRFSGLDASQIAGKGA